MRRRLLAFAGCGLAALALSACGSSGSTTSTGSGGGGGTASGTASTPTHVIQATASGFNAESIYQEAEPGVVTITSVFNPAAERGISPTTSATVGSSL